MLFSHSVVKYMLGDDPTERTTRVTFACEQAEENTYNYAAAWTSPTDNFSKKIGRAIASGRLNANGDQVYQVTTAAETYGSIFETVMADAMDKGPSRWTILDITFFKALDVEHENYA